ncbi:MAG: Protein-N(5)-glutamine methyltransferase PrmC, methylates polypeptide chain release factor [Polaromonas sp.]|nr:Protein-N(5)-glutamine methyltransferase PrmC, methylates polypeptide chain release factor [Polaromonas sp.]
MTPPSPDALATLGRWLRDTGYRFVTPTPATHARLNARPGAQEAKDLRDVFGWSRPFRPALLPDGMLDVMHNADLLETVGDRFRSRVRFSSLDDQLYAHSAFPTDGEDAVFFGPDSYRFALLVDHELALEPLAQGARILDMGCGGGPGGIEAALVSQAASPQLVLADVNPHALAHARANVLLAGLPRVSFAQGDLYAAVEGDFDLILANPPYLVDAAARTYRHGGGALGSALSERVVADGLPRLAPGGRLVLYTGAAVVDGQDVFLQRVLPLLAPGSWPFRYRELDPDVFGEELDAPAYAQAERIAAVALVVWRPVSAGLP